MDREPDRIEELKAERHELKNKLAVQQNWQTLYEREKADNARLREALLAPSATGGCTGGGDCPATKHLHGCYRDDGNCDYPDHHEAGSSSVQTQKSAATGSGSTRPSPGTGCLTGRDSC